MARGRFINTTIATDTKLNSLSIEAHWLYMMTIPHLDRDGLIVADTYVLFGRVCPRRPEIISRIDALISEWVASGLVTVYPSDDGQIAYFHGFTKNQQGMTYSREGVSTLPPPPGYTRTNSGLTHDQLTISSRPAPDEITANINSNSNINMNVKGKGKAQAPPSPANDIAFVEEESHTPQQAMYGAICEALGWDYHVIADKEKVRVAQAVKILTKADYGVEDIRRFMTEIWFNDWRWKKDSQYPTLEQLRQDIGKLRSVVPSVALPKTKGMSSLNRLSESIRGQA